MGTLGRAAFGLLGWLPLLLACGERSSRNDEPCATCTTDGGGGSTSSASSAGADGGNERGGRSDSMGGLGGAGTGHGGETAGRAPVAGAAGLGAGGEATQVPTAPERLVEVKLVRNLIVKDGSIFFSDVDGNEQGRLIGHVRSVSVNGGAARTYAQGNDDSVLEVWGIATDGAYVYWTEHPLNASRVAKTSIATGETSDLWSDPKCDARMPLVLEGAQLYWLATCVGVSGQLMTVATAGGQASVVASGNEPGWLPNPYGADEGARGLAVGNGFAAWTQVTGAVVSLPLVGGQAPLQIKTITQVDGPAAIAMVGERAFFLQPDYMQQARGDVYSFVPGTDFVTVATSVVHISQEQLSEKSTALTVDDQFVYWGVTDGIKRAPLGGGDAVTVVSGLPNTKPRALAVDEAGVYWADDTGIWRAPKLR